MKYLDDTIAVSVYTDPDDLSQQLAAVGLCVWSRLNVIVNNANKTKEMMVFFDSN